MERDILVDEGEAVTKGKEFLDAGYVYAPYVPLQVTPMFLDDNNFQSWPVMYLHPSGPVYQTVYFLPADSNDVFSSMRVTRG